MLTVLLCVVIDTTSITGYQTSNINVLRVAANPVRLLSISNQPRQQRCSTPPEKLIELLLKGS